MKEEKKPDTDIYPEVYKSKAADEIKLPDFYTVVGRLPKLIAKSVYLMDTDEEKKMTLYAISIISGALMPKVWINYGGKVNYPALMVMMAYPPASGKGKLALLPLVLRKIIDEQKKINNQSMAQYRLEMKIYEKNVGKGNPPGEMPKKPNLRVLLVPGNTTASKLTEQLAENDGEEIALIFETEIDSFTNMMNNQFGRDNSMIIRKAFHNENISQMRKNNSEHLEISNPKIAMLLTGTNSQIPNLFQSNEDGLFSRFMIATGSAPMNWKDVQPCESCKPLNEDFEKMDVEFYNMYHFFKGKSIEVKFKDSHWEQINLTGEARLKESFEEAGEYATSIAKRHSNMIVRLAAIFRMVRYFECQEKSSVVYCNDDDFENANWMIHQSYLSSIELFKMLPGQKQDNSSSRVEEFFELLPKEFRTKETAPLQAQMKVSNRTIQRFLKELLENGKLVSPKKGIYQKGLVADVADGRSS
jgi:hypothetical protein